jgi:proteasome lid subunit RPN8/RPN11
MIKLRSAQVEEMFAHAREMNPAECCGLVGGAGDGHAHSVYRLRNVSAEPLVAYEAAAEDLFAAQKLMRERGEQLLGIYHSHPRAPEPVPSMTDVRLAYYPLAVYFIIGLSDEGARLRAFRIDETLGHFEHVDFHVLDERVQGN